MRELPAGMVTFLLTDVEGSTALWERSPDTMQIGLSLHDMTVSAAIEAHDGVVVKHRGEGDSIFAVFTASSDAVAAAAEIQRSLTAVSWPMPWPIAVRIGIHTGEAQLREGDYYGPVVNRCARLRSIGHGGQILLSGTTSTLVRDLLPPETTLVDLGLHRLKDLARPERVAQLTVHGLRVEFPPLASLDAHPHNLPVQSTPFIGRHREVQTVRQRLAHEDVRLVTLTGPGGTGKTRLALQVAVELVGLYADGVFFVDLASISDPALLVPTIAQVLGVAETDDRPILDSLLDYLRRRHMLLLLDNFEQILDAAGTLDALLHTCPGLAILVTSRAPLQLRVEHESPVPPLGVPDVRRLQQPGLQAEALSRYDAVELFVERALAIRPDFILTNTNASAVAELCARLDGLPLAIELAAARLRLLSPEAMLPRLGHGLDLLAGGRRDLPARQQTLRNTIAWSYELLSATERRLFRHLSVFVGGFTLAAAAAVCGTTLVPGPASDPGSETRRSAEIDVLDVIGALVDHNLLRPTEVTADEPRFAMLETIREYGLEQLEASGEKDDVRRLHLAWCVDLSNRSAQLGRGAAQGAWLDRLEAEYDNLRAALRCSEAASCDPEIGLRLATTLANAFWPMRGHFHEGRGWLTRLLARPTARTVVRADALNRAGYLAMRQNDYAAALPLFDEALAIWREIGDANGTAVTLRNLGVVAHHQGDHDRARTMFEESLPLHRQLGDRYGVQMSQLYFADLLRDCGEDARAATSYEEGLNLARERGDGHGVAYALRGLGHMARVRGDYARAGELLRESLELLRPLRDRRCIPLCLEGLACIAIGPDWADRATRLLGAANAIQSNTGAPAPPSELADYQRTEADARSTLGMEQFAAVWAEGTMLPLDAVIAYALEGAGEAHTASARAPSPRPVLVAPSESSAAVRTQPPDGPRLSARECEVVTLIAGGLSNRQIAERLVLSVRTVERHIENVYNRLGISGKAGRAIVTAYAIRHHLIDSL